MTFRFILAAKNLLWKLQFIFASRSESKHKTSDKIREAKLKLKKGYKKSPSVPIYSEIENANMQVKFA